MQLPPPPGIVVALNPQTLELSEDGMDLAEDGMNSADICVSIMDGQLGSQIGFEIVVLQEPDTGKTELCNNDAVHFNCFFYKWHRIS